MERFDVKCTEFFGQLGEHGIMVLSTSLNDKVTSRMMSIVIIHNKFYFQTDKSFRKYNQLQGNPNAALCINNVQIEGVCIEIGHPLDNKGFCDLYKQYYRSSYENYTVLTNERLFVMEPVYVQKWIYIDDKPYVETYDFDKGIYQKSCI